MTSPSSLLAKLDELKRWQQEQQERLLKQHQLRFEDSVHSENETIKGLSAYETIRNQFDTGETESATSNNEMVRDIYEMSKVQRENSNEEKLSSAKPKKVFLKRGEGLTKFGMKPGDQKRPFKKMRPPQTAVHRRLAELRKTEKAQIQKIQEIPQVENKIASSTVKDKYLSNTNFIENSSKTRVKQVLQINKNSIDVKRDDKLFENFEETENFTITPLKMPDMIIQPKAKWCNSEEDDTQKSDAIISQINELATSNLQALKRIDQQEEHEQNEKTQLLACLQKLALEKFGEPLKNESAHLNDELLNYLHILAEKYNEYASLNESSNYGELTAYEKGIEKELAIFEQLEKKVMNNSFCSTNSSILNLLSSTPHKNRTEEKKQSEELTETKCVQFNDNKEQPNAKKVLDFQEIVEQSDESSITSDDLQKTIEADEFDKPEEWTQFEETSQATSTSSLHSCRPVIIRQNACVNTDEADFPKIPDLSDFPISQEIIEDKQKELDREIRKYQVENKKLTRLQNETEKEKRELQKERKRLEKELLDERIQLEYEFGEEKKKLAKEKMVFEKYAKELQNKPSKKERDEISRLKTELENVKEVLKLKETRNGTTQARLRNQLKALEKENTILKDETEKLQKQNAKLVAAQKVRKPSESKMLNEINKNLTKLTQDAKKKDAHKENKKNKAHYETEYRRSFSGGNVNTDENSSDDEKIKSFQNWEKENSFEKVGNKNYQRRSRRSPERFEDDRSGNRKSYPRDSSEENIGRNDQRRNSETYNVELEQKQNYKVHEFDEISKKSNSTQLLRGEVGLDSVLQDYASKSNESASVTDNTSNLKKSFGKENNQNSANSDMTTFQNISDLSLVQNYEKVFGTKPILQRNNSLNDTQAQSTMEDGSKQVKYPNGNIKVISPDGNKIQVKYFNGDVKETSLIDGSIRYFYAETEMSQTTFVNGDETLEFADGQIEKHFSDGTMEITFPNGVVKRTDKDGSENISYPDGSVVKINGEDEKVLFLPNGQKEIHTSEHKRREYPDGTIKILYPDGLQETRYSNGRIRMKDKDGNLIMDSHSDNT